MVSQIQTAAGLVRARFNTLVTVGETLPTVWDNAPDQTLPGSGRWCRFSMRFGQQEQLTIAGATSAYRTASVALVQLFEPIGAGDGTQLGLVDAIVDAFRGVVLAGPPVIHFDPPYVSAPPSVDDGLWLQVVTIPFRVQD